MHIPSCPSDRIAILSFEDARTPRADSAAYDREKWIYVPDFYSEYRQQKVG